ncbi:LLM class flavin-dependent oxidoreductase [Umezawaea endophytica]|uniref:LLM class flavin-dependent oxidoreductase n=1 Tax=Umezawaea endophytica TaxID=1654476 RepID=A0A9X2VLC7_9PSEU|nr:LLM class flavin-dependent oxidoreductase [Umezawaea endophytica]MCS7478700.1 LLM class flavin-dependent oxidoreductase [Umezawaea endophytica]
MDVGLGVLLDAARLPGARLTDLAVRAEQRGLDLVVVGGVQGGLDPLTVAAWVAGATSRILVGVADAGVPPAPDTGDPEQPFPFVVDKSLDGLGLLSGDRLLRGPGAWSVAVDSTIDAVKAAAGAGVPVVVAVRTVHDVDRVVELRVVDHARRPASVRARRMPGIDYEGVPDVLAAGVVEPGDSAYRSVASTYMRGGAPGLVLRATTVEEVAAAITFARRHTDLPLGVRSGGHGFSGRSTNHGGLVVDVGGMDGVEVIDPDRRLVRVGPGASWKRVATALRPYGWAIGSGDAGGVGVGGLATAGGIGFLSRKQGLTIDRVRAVELVLADGSPIRASDDENPDLFWALRGAGANFGVATAFEIEAEPIGDVGWASLALVVDDVAEALEHYGRVASEAPRDTTLFMMIGPPRGGRSVMQLYGVVDNADPDTIISRLTPFARIGPIVQQSVTVSAYADVMDMTDTGPGGHQGVGEPVARSTLFREFTPEVARLAADAVASGGVGILSVRQMGGAIADVPEGATAFSHRDAGFAVAVLGSNARRVDAAWDPVRGLGIGSYLSFETDQSPERLGDAFPPPVLDRLRELKRRYDPGFLFRDNFPIDPRPADARLEETAR